MEELFYNKSKPHNFNHIGGFAELTLKDGVKLLHREYGMTLSQIGDLLGVTTRTIENYEKGKTVPRTPERYYDFCEIIMVELKTRPIKRRKRRWII